MSWCTWEELRRRTGIRSRDSLSRAITGLVSGGWLVVVEKARQHRSARYRLVIPTLPSSPDTGRLEPASSPESGPLNGAQQSDFGSPAVRFPPPSSPDSGPDLSKISPTDQSRAREPSTLAAVVVDALRERTGRTIDHDHADRVARQILGDRDITAPLHFVVGAIKKDANPGRFLPTPTPPPFVRPEAAHAPP